MNRKTAGALLLGVGIGWFGSWFLGNNPEAQPCVEQVASKFEVMRLDFYTVPVMPQDLQLFGLQAPIQLSDEECFDDEQADLRFSDEAEGDQDGPPPEDTLPIREITPAELQRILGQNPQTF